MAHDCPEDLLEEYEELEDYLSGDDESEFDLSPAGTIDDHFAKIAVVDNLPIVGKEKIPKLTNVLTKIYSQFGEFQDGGIEMPMGGDKTLGFALVPFKIKENCVQAVSLTNGFKLDKKHIFQVNKYSDLAKFNDWPDQYVQPQRPEFPTPENMRWYLEDEAGRDQYVTREGSDTKIYFCEGVQLRGEGKLVYGGERERGQGKVWCELYTAWSPLGNYLATYHRQGIAIWGGKNFTKIMRFKHLEVQCLQFSPCENYLVTWNGKFDKVENEPLKVHDVKSGRLLRAFEVKPNSVWPMMKWSYDDRFIARLLPGQGISVYEAPSMQMLQDPMTGGKKRTPVRAKGIQHFDWSPGANVIAYWAPEMEEKPARVVLIDPVKRSEVRSKNLVSVSDVKLHWQDSGDFLAAQVLRHSKTGKTLYTNLEIFRMRDRNIPNETVDLKDRVEHFSWEPQKERFGVIHGDSQIRFSISFYTMGAIKGGKSIEKLYTVVDKQANLLFWSPLGNAVVMAGMQSVEVKLEFWDVDEQLSTNNAEHFMCNEISWDPSGRMLATIASQPMFGTVGVREKLGNGFNLWTFQGNSLRRVQTQHFYQFAWRPRPKSTLTDKDRADVSKNLKKYMSRFEREDGVRRKRIDAAANLEKLQLLTSFRNRMDDLNNIYEEDRKLRIEQGLWVEEQDEEFIEIEETIEEVLSEKITPWSPNV